MRLIRRMIPLLAALVVLNSVAPVALGAKPTGSVTQNPCFFSQADTDGTWPGLRVTVDWSGVRVSRILVEVWAWTSGFEERILVDDHQLDRAAGSGSYLSNNWPMKYWNLEGSSWAIATFADYRVRVYSRNKVLLDYTWFFDPNRPTIPACS